MEKNEELIQILEKALNDLRKLQVSKAKQEEFEAYVKGKLEHIANEIATIRKAIV